MGLTGYQFITVRFYRGGKGDRFLPGIDMLLAIQDEGIAGQSHAGRNDCEQLQNLRHWRFLSTWMPSIGVETLQVGDTLGLFAAYLGNSKLGTSKDILGVQIPWVCAGLAGCGDATGIAMVYERKNNAYENRPLRNPK